MFTPGSSITQRDVIDGVHMKTLAHGAHTMICEFVIDKGAVIPMHDHPNEQTGYLVSGRLEFAIEDEVMVAEPGTAWNLAAGLSHGARALETCLVVEVFSPVREDYLP